MSADRTVSSGSGRSGTTAQRETMVGSRSSARSAVTRITVRPGGSSSVFKKAFIDSLLAVSNRSSRATRRRASTGFSDRSLIICRTDSILILALRTLLPLITGSTVSRSGCRPRAANWQWRHWPQGGSAAWHSSARAKSLARVRLPMPAGPVNR